MSVLIGTELVELLSGTDQDDTITGAIGDTFVGGSGNDLISAVSGNNLLRGGFGQDTIIGGTDADVLRGGAAADILSGNSGDDTLSGGTGADTIRGGMGNDLMQGGIGTDVLNGNKDNDTIDGGADADTIRGGLGNDLLSGGEANDILVGGLGLDIQTGGSGDDTFTMVAGDDAQDVITDFETGDDRVNVTALGITNFNQLTINYIDGDAIVTGSGLNLLMQDIASGSLVAADFGVTSGSIGGGGGPESSLRAVVDPGNTITLTGTPLAGVTVNLTQAAGADVIQENGAARTLTETVAYNQANITTVDAGALEGTNGITVVIQQSDAGDLTTFTAPAAGTATLEFSTTGDYTGQTFTNFDQITTATADGEFILDSADINGNTISVVTDAGDNFVVTALNATSDSSSDISGITETGDGTLDLRLSSAGGDFRDFDTNEFDNFNRIITDVADGTYQVAINDLSENTLQFVTDAGDTILLDADATDDNTFDILGISKTGAGVMDLRLTTSGGNYTGYASDELDAIDRILLTQFNGTAAFQFADITGETIQFVTDDAADVISLTVVNSSVSAGVFAGITETGTGSIGISYNASGGGDVSGVDTYATLNTMSIALVDAELISDIEDFDNATIVISSDSTSDILTVRALSATDDSTYNIGGISEDGGFATGIMNLQLAVAGDFTGFAANELDWAETITTNVVNGEYIFDIDDISGETMSITSDSASDIFTVRILSATDDTNYDLGGLTETGGFATGIMNMQLAVTGDFSGFVNTEVDFFQTITTDAVDGEYILSSDGVSNTSVQAVTDTGDNVVILAAANTDDSSFDIGSVTETGGGTLDLRLGATGDFSNYAANELDNINRILTDVADGSYSFEIDDLSGNTIQFVTDAGDSASVSVNTGTDDTDFNLDNISETGSGTLDMIIAASDEDYTGFSATELDGFDRILVNLTDGNYTFSAADITGETLEFVTDDANDRVILSATSSEANAADFVNITRSGAGSLRLLVSDSGSITGVDTLVNFQLIDVRFSTGNTTIDIEDLNSAALEIQTAGDDGVTLVAVSATADTDYNISSVTQGTGGENGGFYNLLLNVTGDFTGFANNELDWAETITTSTVDGEYTLSSSALNGLTIQVVTDDGDSVVITTAADTDDGSFALDSITKTGAGTLDLRLGATGDYTGYGSNEIDSINRVLTDVTDGEYQLGVDDLDANTIQMVTDAGDNVVVAVSATDDSTYNLGSLTETGGGTLDLRLTSVGGDYRDFAANELDGFERIVMDQFNDMVNFNLTDITGETIQIVTDNSSDILRVLATRAEVDAGVFAGITETGQGSMHLVVESGTGSIAGVDTLTTIGRIDISASNGTVTADAADLNGATTSIDTDANDVFVVSALTATADTDYVLSGITENGGGGSLDLQLAVAGDFTGFAANELDGFYRIVTDVTTGTYVLSPADISGETISFVTGASDVLSFTATVAEMTGGTYTGLSETGNGTTELTFTDGGDASAFSSAQNIGFFDVITTATTATTLVLANEAFTVNLEGTANHSVDLVAFSTANNEITIDIDAAAGGQLITLTNFITAAVQAADFDVLNLVGLALAAYNGEANTAGVDAAMAAGGAVLDTDLNILKIDLDGSGTYVQANDLRISMAGVTDLTAASDIVIV